MEETEIQKLMKEQDENRYKKAVIISGGTIEREHALSVLQKNEYAFIIGADAGLRFLHKEGICPTHIVGDFDSLEQNILEEYMNDPRVTIRMFSPIKDKTDTEIAIRLAMELGATEIMLLGGNGPRVDHTLVNIQTLTIPMEAGIPCVMADACNEIRVIDQKMIIHRSDMPGKYVSFVPLGGTVEGLTVTGVKYPLDDHDLTPTDSLGVSNEVIAPFAIVAFRKGRLIVIFSKDKEKNVE